MFHFSQLLWFINKDVFHVRPLRLLDTTFHPNLLPFHPISQFMIPDPDRAPYPVPSVRLRLRDEPSGSMWWHFTFFSSPPNPSLPFFLLLLQLIRKLVFT